MYDYLLGGNHNFAVDRALAEQVLTAQPQVRRIALTNRAFLRRSVLFMMANGVRQFLDLGSGIPTVGNVHEIAQQTDPNSRVVYVDNEHVAVAHSQLMLEGNENAAVVHADITKPGLVLNDPATKELIDFDQPVGLLAFTIGHYVLEDAVEVFAAYEDVCPPGSHLALSHMTNDFTSFDGDEISEFMKRSQNNVKPRTRAEVLELFRDWELVEPGLVTSSQWRPEQETDVSANTGDDGVYAGVARKN
jgi:hypothetical protein